METIKYIFCVLVLLFLSNIIKGNVIEPIYDPKGIVSESKESLLKEMKDFSFFVGRVTDRDTKNESFKIKSETNNVKFFRVGDLVYIRERRGQSRFCRSYVKGIEDFYFVVHIPNLNDCREKRGPFRLGTQLFLKSKVLLERIVYAWQYKLILLERKDNLLKQLKGANQFLWGYSQNRSELLAEFDKKILKIEKEKQRALDGFLGNKKDQLELQKQLMKKLDIIDENLKFYRIERQENFTDRWHLDHDLVPVSTSPNELIKMTKENSPKKLWNNF